MTWKFWTEQTSRKNEVQAKLNMGGKKKKSLVRPNSAKKVKSRHSSVLKERRSESDLVSWIKTGATQAWASLQVISCEDA